jgi:hypothetical protein
MAVPGVLETTRAITEILAFLGAAAYFGYKAMTGYLIINVSLSGELHRSHSDSQR